MSYLAPFPGYRGVLIKLSGKFLYFAPSFMFTFLLKLYNV